jgi:hypothetical protein
MPIEKPRELQGIMRKILHKVVVHHQTGYRVRWLVPVQGQIRRERSTAVLDDHHDQPKQQAKSGVAQTCRR